MKSSTSVRVRFAPSPTGYLHVGGARTALFNYLYACHKRGRFLLRIEDTDKKRSDPQLTKSIFDSLKWLGLSWDESPLYQSQRQQRHKDICRELLESGNAYRCFCKPEDLEKKRKSARTQGVDAKYNCNCYNLSKKKIQSNLQRNSPFTLRFRVPQGETKFYDMIHGCISVRHNEIEDFIIQRSDGSPVYQIAVITDDHDMGITHILRGDDHLSNTPKQILLYQALGWDLPEFGHVPLIFGPDKKRLSKRHGATSVETYRDQGILPEALINFLALLGWSPGNDREIMDMNTLIKLFSLDKISQKPAVFDFQKLEWMNSVYISDMNNGLLIEYLHKKLLELGWISISVNEDQTSYLNQILDLLKPRMKMLNDFIDQADYFFQNPDYYEEKAVQKYWSEPDTKNRMALLQKKLKQCSEWDKSSLEPFIRNAAEEINVGAGKLIHPLRLAITGRGASPGLFEVMALLGKDIVLARLKRAIRWLDDQIYAE